MICLAQFTMQQFFLLAKFFIRFPYFFQYQGLAASPTCLCRKQVTYDDDCYFSSIQVHEINDFPFIKKSKQEFNFLMFYLVKERSWDVVYHLSQYTKGSLAHSVYHGSLEGVAKHWQQTTQVHWSHFHIASWLTHFSILSI